jgi:DNA-directed RNA polymerase specialized sigma24 family protein
VTVSTNPSEPDRRLDAAVRHVYPRLLIQADRLLRTRRVHGVEASDLCQEAALASAIYLRGFPPGRLMELSEEALTAVLFSVAARVIHSRVVDHVRTCDVRRRCMALEAPVANLDTSLESRQEAKSCLRQLLRQTKGAMHEVLVAALEIGDFDASVLARRTGFSRAYTYRLLQALLRQARIQSDA